MSKFTGLEDACKHLGGLIHTPRHGVSVLHSVRRDGMLEAPEGFYVKLRECSAIEDADAEVSSVPVDSGDFESGRSVGYAEGFEAGSRSVVSEAVRDGLISGQEWSEDEVKARAGFVGSAYNDGYEKGYADGKAVVLNGTAILEPKLDPIAESSGEPVIQDAQGLEGSEGSEGSECSEGSEGSECSEGSEGSECSEGIDSNFGDL